MVIIKRILVISDIHGCLDEFEQLLEKVNYDINKDQLILLGDYVDRGFKSKDLLNEVNGLLNEGVIALKGNHDQMFLDWLTLDDYVAALNFFRNGGFSTVTSYVGNDWFENGYDEELALKAKKFIHKHYYHHVEFLQNLKYYHETPEYIFVHAGINVNFKDWKNTDHEDFIWIRDQFLKYDHEHPQTVIHGHTPCINLHETADIYFRNKKIGIDGACAYGHQLNCLEIKDGQYKQYEIERKRHS